MSKFQYSFQYQVQSCSISQWEIRTSSMCLKGCGCVHFLNSLPLPLPLQQPQYDTGQPNFLIGWTFKICVLEWKPFLAKHGKGGVKGEGMTLGLSQILISSYFKLSFLGVSIFQVETWILNIRNRKSASLHWICNSLSSPYTPTIGGFAQHIKCHFLIKIFWFHSNTLNHWFCKWI